MKSNRTLLQVVLLVVTFCGAAWAQNGSITGTVKDPSGAALSGATVVISSPERGINRQTTTNSTGEYNESALSPGSYNIFVTATGFKKYQAKDVKLDVGEKARIDVTLEVGSISTEVVVQGESVAPGRNAVLGARWHCEWERNYPAQFEWAKFHVAGYAGSGREQSDGVG